MYSIPFCFACQIWKSPEGLEPQPSPDESPSCLQQESVESIFGKECQSLRRFDNTAQPRYTVLQKWEAPIYGGNMIQYQTIVENDAFWAKFAVVAEHEDQAKDLIRQALTSRRWKDVEASEQREMGWEHPHPYAWDGDMENCGEPEGSPHGDILLRYGSAWVYLVDSGANG